MNILDFLIPKTNIKTYLSSSYLEQLDTYTKSHKSEYIEMIWFIFKYKDPVIKTLLSDIKINLEFDKIKEMSDIIHKAIEHLIKSKKSPKFDIISSVTADKKRLNSRGFFLPDELINNTCNIFKIQTNTLELASQKKSKRSYITLSVKLNKNLSTYKTILLIDDVVTSGLTFISHAKIIKNKYPNIKVYCLAFAGV
jgi:predicted amidophosphoribosyltransferase